MLFRFLIGSGILLFTMEHPHFVALSAVLYLFSQAINEKETLMLKEFASKGSIWLTKLNAFSRSKGMTMEKGREVASDMLETFYNSLTKEQVDEFLSNDRVKDIVNKVIVDELNSEVDAQETWEAYPLGESDLLDEEEINFISAMAPQFDWDAPYTFKAHRQLFKTLKSKFRNSDGTITDEIGNKAVLEIERWIYSFMTGTNCESYGENNEIVEYLLKEGYKNEANI